MKESSLKKKTLKGLQKIERKTQTFEMKETVLIAEKFIKANLQILSAENVIKIPQQNEITCIRTQQQLNLFSIILLFIEKYGVIDFLSITTYTFNKKTLLAFKKLLDEGKIKKIQFIITETLSYRMPAIYELVKKLFSKNKNANVVFYWIHAKIILLQVKKEKFVLDGSGNFSMNAHVEHYNIFNSESVFDLDLKWQNDFFFSKKLRKGHEIFKNFDYAV